MPPIARTVALLLIVIAPTALAAQPLPGGGLPPNTRSTPPPRWNATSANRPLVTPPEFARSVPPPSGAESVVPAAYQAPAAKQGPALGSGVSVPPRPLPVAAESPTNKGDAALPLSPPRRRAAVPLPARGAKSDSAATAHGLDILLTTGGALALVVGLILILAWAVRRAAPRGSFVLPGDVVEVLGRAPLASRQQVHLLRCGNRLLLVSVTPTGTETLTEITDPAEVDRLAGLCQQSRPNSATAVFRKVLQQFSDETEDPRFAEDDGQGLARTLADYRHQPWGSEDV